MKGLLDDIEKCIKSAIEKYTVLISNKYEIDTEELIELWNNDFSDIKIKKSVTKSKTSSSKKNKKKDTDVSDEDENDENGENVEVKKPLKCPYVFSKGKNAGETCGSKSKEGGTYCSKHSKFEEIGQVEKKKTPKVKESSKSMSSKVTSSKKNSPEKKPTERIIKLNMDIDKFWNAETQLVFKSKDDRIVIASYRDGVLKELTDDDIILCEKYGFKYNKEYKLENSVKEDEIKKNKKESESESKKGDKKSLSTAIKENNIQAKDIENILDELQFNDDDNEVNDGNNEDDNELEYIEEEYYDEE